MVPKQKLADQIRANAEMAKDGEKKRKGGKRVCRNLPVQAPTSHRTGIVRFVNAQYHATVILQFVGIQSVSMN